MVKAGEGRGRKVRGGEGKKKENVGKRRMQVGKY